MVSALKTALAERLERWRSAWYVYLPLNPEDMSEDILHAIADEPTLQTHLLPAQSEDIENWLTVHTGGLIWQKLP